MKNSCAITPEFDGQRLDKALVLCAPELGLRGRRRLWEGYRVLVDGREREKNYRVHAGQKIFLEPLNKTKEKNPAQPELEIAAEDEQYAAIIKPRSMHSAALAGKDEPSVEAALDSLWPGRGARLLNRLDFATSGLLVAAFSREAAEAFWEYENLGQVVKRYLALVAGEVAEPFVIRRVLDTDNRKKTRVAGEDSDDGLRHTTVEPLGAVSRWNGTLVRASIKKGARHQIRAHLAHAGHPIVGDALYGQAGVSDTLFLHHCSITFPGFSARHPPDWMNEVSSLCPEGLERILS